MYVGAYDIQITGQDAFANTLIPLTFTVIISEPYEATHDADFPMTEYHLLQDPFVTSSIVFLPFNLSPNTATIEDYNLELFDSNGGSVGFIF